MKMIYNGAPVKSLNVHHFEMDTNDATLTAPDMQVGITAYAKGKKIIGTGKAFEFATYGAMETNKSDFIPTLINVVEIASLDYPIRNLIAFKNMRDIDFSIGQVVGNVLIENIEYPITINIKDNIVTFNCEKEVTLQVFLGKDRYT